MERNAELAGHKGHSWPWKPKKKKLGMVTIPNKFGLPYQKGSELSL